MKTEYELERENRIKENDAMLASLFGSKPARDIRPSQDDISVNPNNSESSSSRPARSNIGQKQLYTAKEVDYLLAKEEDERARNPEDKRPPSRYILAVIELPRRSARPTVRRSSRAIKRVARDSSSDGEYRNRRPKKSNVRRVVSGRIYDAAHGTSCHQCRQKTMDPKAHCSTCNYMFDLHCLQQRYGDTEEQAKEHGWSCPYCRGDCNCSQCRKKKGLRPTGILVHVARGNGYRSVSHYLKKDLSGEPNEAILAGGRSGRGHRRGHADELQEDIKVEDLDDKAYAGLRSSSETMPKTRPTRAAAEKARMNLQGAAEEDNEPPATNNRVRTRTPSASQRSKTSRI